MKHPHVKILVVGQKGVGKSSLIAKCMVDYPNNQLYSSMLFQSHEFTVPSFHNDTNHLHLNELSDVSGAMTKSELKASKEALVEAHIIVGVYKVGDVDSLHYLDQLMIMLREYSKCSHKTVILVGNSYIETSETIEGIKLSTAESEIIDHLFAVHPFIYESTNFSIANNPHSFFMSQMENWEDLALNPPTLIWDRTKKCFTAKCIRIFKRIFYLFDKDADKFLNNSEFKTALQVCLGTALPSDSQADFVREQLVSFSKSRSMSPSLFATTNEQDAVNFEGFLSLQYLIFCNSSSFSSIWKLLRFFGYNLNLRYIPLPTAPDKHDFRLGAFEINFLTSLFNEYAENATSNGETSTLYGILSYWLFEDEMPWSRECDGGTTWRLAPSFKTSDDADMSDLVFLLDVTCTVQNWIVHWLVLSFICPRQTERLVCAMGCEHKILHKFTGQPTKALLVKVECDSKESLIGFANTFNGQGENQVGNYIGDSFVCAFFCESNKTYSVFLASIVPVSMIGRNTIYQDLDYNVTIQLVDSTFYHGNVKLEMAYTSSEGLVMEVVSLYESQLKCYDSDKYIKVTFGFGVVLIAAFCALRFMKRS